MLDAVDVEKVDYWISAQFRGAKCDAWERIKKANVEAVPTVRAKRPVQQRKAKIVRCCNTCGSQHICQSTHGCGGPNFKHWQRPTSAVA